MAWMPPDRPVTLPTHLAFDPVQVGVLVDLEFANLQIFLNAIRLALDEARAARRLPRAVELVVKEATGLPRRGAHHAVEGWRALAAGGCVCIVGPQVSDNARVLRDVVEAEKVPTIAWAGTEAWGGEYCFAVQNGSQGEEAAIMAAYLARKGLRRIAVLHERSPVGIEYHEHFRREAARVGLGVVAEHEVSALPETVRDALVAARETRPDALVHLGFGYPVLAMAPLWPELGWDPPRITTGAFQFHYANLTWRRAYEGWVGIDQTSEENPRFLALQERYERCFGERPDHTVLALGYDTGVVVAEGITRAPLLAPAGVKTGLERIRLLGAATGGPRTFLSIRPHDHRALKGDWLVLRRIRDGQSLFESYHEPAP